MASEHGSNPIALESNPEAIANELDRGIVSARLVVDSALTVLDEALGLLEAKVCTREALFGQGPSEIAEENRQELGRIRTIY